jgi:hypothetical protein
VGPLKSEKPARVVKTTVNLTTPEANASKQFAKMD